ncbi:PepSY domain-containing protein [Alkalicoccobacillus porphyridii]|nr:PepSY domain-containing protein [Alkalicoccobacillus porphyridii]
MKSPIRITLSIIALVLSITVVLFLVFRPLDQSVSMEDVREMIVSQYGSEPTEIRLADGIYYASIERIDGLYEIEISEETGTILALVPLEDREPEPSNGPVEQLNESEARQRFLELAPNEANIKTLTLVNSSPPIWRAEIDTDTDEGNIEIDAISGEERSNDFSGELMEQPTYISEENAKEIALAEVDGVVDDVDLEEADGRMVYEVEIENEETDEDVTIIIDAITGQIIQFEY